MVTVHGRRLTSFLDIISILPKHSALATATMIADQGSQLQPALHGTGTLLTILVLTAL